MLRATGSGRRLTPWTRGRQFRSAGATFGRRPIRLAAATAVVGLLIGNALLVYELREDAGPIRQTAPARDAEHGAGATDLRSALDAVEAEIRAGVGRLSVRYGETPDRGSRSQESSAGRGAGTVAQSEGERTISTSTRPVSGGSSSESSSYESDTAAGSGGSSGSSAGGETSDHSSSESSGGSSGGSGTGDSGDTGGSTSGGTGSGGAGGAGGGGDSSGGGDVSGSGGGGGGGGG